MMNDWQEYLLKKYPKRFKNKKIIVTERETHFEIQSNKDEGICLGRLIGILVLS